MKKIATILMLAATLLLGGMSADAKTTHKKSGSKTSKTTSQSGALSVTAFLHKENQSGTLGFNFNSDSQIETALKKAGFSLKSKNVKKEQIEDGTEGDTASGTSIEYVYTKSGITVRWYSYAYDEAPEHYYKDWIVIKFSDSATKNAFINNVKSNGFKKEGNTYVDPAYMINIDTEGNTVTISGNWA